MHGFYIARRLVWTVVVVAAVIAITFAVFYLLPAGDPALRFAGKNPNPAEIAQIHQRLGLDQPWYVQFGKFTQHFFIGDQYGWPGLGYTYAERGFGEEPDHATRSTHTLPDRRRGCHLARARASRSGSSRRRQDAGRVVDRTAMGFALVGISTPVFWLGLMALFIFWRQLGWTGGTGLRLPGRQRRPDSSRT